MPLKPIFEKSPLVTMKELPLRPGQVRMENESLARLYAMSAAAKEQPALWEGVFRAAALLKAKPTEEPVCTWIAEALARQVEDGSMSVSVTEALGVMRAAWAMYEHDARRALLEQLAAWCGWLSQHWDEVLACNDIRTRAADLMDLLINLYRVTGKKAILSLCDKLRQQAMDWSGILHTYAVQRPMNRVTAWQDMKAGMEAEDGSEAGFYTRQYLTCHGESLADGARSATLNSRYTGSGYEATAMREGWAKISRYHGAVCGGITADETISGRSPAQAIDTASLGAWVEAFAVYGNEQDEAWAFAALETLVVNGLPAALGKEGIVPYQRVNGLDANCGTKDCYHVHKEEEQGVRALNRLLRGWSAAASAAVGMRCDGASVNLLLSGRYAVPVDGGAMVLDIACTEEGATLKVRMRKPCEAVLRIRIPDWTNDACITVNDEGGDEGKPGTYLELKRTWTDGDTVRIEFARPLQVKAGHHQSAAIYYGATLMAYPASKEKWALALCGEPVLENGRVLAPLAKTGEWRKHGSIPADLPVLPEVQGETEMIELKPYAETPCRIALFPKGSKA